MNRKKIILTSLASVAVLGAALAASQPSVVKADESTNTTTASSQPAGTTDPSATHSNSTTNSAENGSLSTVVGDEKLTSREDLIGLLFFYVQSDEDTFLKVDEVSKTEAQPFDVFNQLVGSFQFCV